MHVVPDWCDGKTAVAHPRQKDRLAVRIVVTVGDGLNPISQGDSESPDSAK